VGRRWVEVVTMWVSPDHNSVTAAKSKQHNKGMPKSFFFVLVRCCCPGHNSHLPQSFGWHYPVFVKVSMRLMLPWKLNKKRQTS